MRYELREQAKTDLVDVARYYNDEQDGLGDRFLDKVDQQLAQVEIFPELAPVVHGRIRGVQTRPFKLGVFYVVREDRIDVLRVLHLAQDPGELRSKLEHK